jgi:hypothetical protein
MTPTNTAWEWIKFRILQYISYSMHNVSEEVCRVSWKYYSSDFVYKQFVLTHVRKFVSMAFWKQVRREFKVSRLWLRVLSWGVWCRVVCWNGYQCFGSKFCLKIQVSTYYKEARRICLLLRHNNKCWCSHSRSVATVGKTWVRIKYEH